MPGCLLPTYSPVPGVSVPFCCVTRYCSGESLEMASGSLLKLLISFSSCRTCTAVSLLHFSCVGASLRFRLWNAFFDQHSCRAGISQAHRFHSSPLRLVNRSSINHLLVERCQLRAVIGDVHSEQGRGLFCARILTDEMATSGRLKEAFTRLVDFDRSGRGIFGTDRPREYISDDASGVMMYT